MKTMLTGLAVCAATLLATAADDLDHYNVIWATPSHDASGSMPIGNGEVGLNVWVEEDGDLCFYISRTDAWSEACRLLKLGRIRVGFSPNPFIKGSPFHQELKLRDGCIAIVAGAPGHEVKLNIFVDAGAPVIHVIGESAQPLNVRATLEIWRTEKKVLMGRELASSWTMQAAPPEISVWESADVVSNAPGAVTWFHRNEYSVVPCTLKQQGLEGLAALVQDPLLHRITGGRMSARGFVTDAPHTLNSSAPTKRFAIQIATHSAQTDSVAVWEKELAGQAARSSRAQAAARTTAAWWAAFWERSWVFVEGDQDERPSQDRRAPGPEADFHDASPVSRVTQAYILQRWMAICAGRGHYPIKFNGSIFTVNPELTDSTQNFNADWRRWGDCYWWQNTRHPGSAAMACGDYELLRPLFRLYREVSPICKGRAELYYDADGVYFPETMTIFGTYANQDYGWDRSGLKPNEVQCGYWRYAWQQGLELVNLMLDYYDHTGDQPFLSGELIPMAHEVLRYYDTRFARDPNGILIISPTQVIETYWTGVTNDTPSVAGLHVVLDRLLALPGDTANSAEREFWTRMKAATPPLPMRVENRRRLVAPAEQFENPELYAVWPFRIFGVGRPDLETGVETFQRRLAKIMTGWCYDGQCAAMLGLTGEAQRQLLAKVRNTNPHHRFPAMWGPNFDWLPDQDHGSNILLTLQQMLLEASGDKLYLLPAWPREWNVRFKLHAPRQTIVEGEWRDGKMVHLAVTPNARKSGIVVMEK